MGVDKLTLEIAGEPLIRRAVAPLVAARRITDTIVVVRPGADLPLAGLACTVVENPDHAAGMSTSLRAGIAAAPVHTDAYLVSLGDLPHLTADLCDRVVEAFLASPRPILVPRHAERNGHPVVFARACRQDLLALRGDVGARDLLRARPDQVEILPVADAAVIRDVDTPEDLRRD
jgi:molybdenum cofactor cytidylyltransferase